MPTETLLEDPRWQETGLERLASEAVAATLTHLGHDPAGFEVAVLACDDRRIAALNADFRDRPRPTNVLSWPASDLGATTPGARPSPPEPGRGEAAHLGDVALAFETCSAEARALKKPLAHHLSHLLVHGTLHCLGFDHETDADARLMEGLEAEILGKLGLSDPYREDG